MIQPSKQQGFTLVELSIVLVILGLLVGGVLSGQSLIRAAELRSILTDRDKYTTAYYAFKDKYMALPGDMADAYNFFGSMGDPGCASNAIADMSDRTACNGDGNNLIGFQENLSPGVWGGGDQTTEVGKAWLHLKLAGLVESNVTGIVDFWFQDIAPPARYPGALWILDSGFNATVNGHPPGDPFSQSQERGGIYLSLGQYKTTPAVPNLRREEAWNLDVKSDDGRAHEGSTRGGQSCVDVNYDGDPSNGAEDHYAIQAIGPAGLSAPCAIAFIIRK